LDNLLPNDGNSADKMAPIQGIILLRWFMTYTLLTVMPHSNDDKLYPIVTK
jgi:hypothetical protein